MHLLGDRPLARIHRVEPHHGGVLGHRLEGNDGDSAPAQPQGLAIEQQARPTPRGLRRDQTTPRIGHRRTAATASARRGRSSRPNTASTPSRRRTAQIHSDSGGHELGMRVATMFEMNSVPIDSSGNKPASSAAGRAANGRAAARASMATRSPVAGIRERASRSGGGLTGGPTRDISRRPAADIGRPTARARRSGADSPARSDVPATLPADVPTMTSAVRGSQPVTCSRAARTPALLHLTGSSTVRFCSIRTSVASSKSICWADIPFRSRRRTDRSIVRLLAQSSCPLSVRLTLHALRSDGSGCRCTALAA